MAAATVLARGAGTALRRSSCALKVCFSVTDRKKLHTAPVGQAFRLRPFHVLVATGGGYAGYKKYEGYKLEQLEKKGIELPVKLASEWEVAISPAGPEAKVGPAKLYV
ncbi:hypothetical protein ASZ78_008726 [Callipepla squamata]|uniref:Uncharacterized protein n=1 Tax=Callipepla squamata TaxID=9009 RepID=A0A226NBQ1_CALSU|nr:hypothetical protein ASZ78_008726 [Callipepla squamata]